MGAEMMWNFEVLIEKQFSDSRKLKLFSWHNRHSFPWPLHQETVVHKLKQCSCICRIFCSPVDAREILNLRAPTFCVSLVFIALTINVQKLKREIGGCWFNCNNSVALFPRAHLWTHQVSTYRRVNLHKFLSNNRHRLLHFQTDLHARKKLD